MFSRKLMGSFASRGVGSVSQLLINFVLGNYFGAATIGMYYFFISWFAVIATIYALGIPMIALRETAAFAHKGLLGESRLFQYWATKTVFVSSIVMFVPIIVGYVLAQEFLVINATKANIFLMAAVFAFFVAQTKLYSEVLKGHERVSAGLFLEYGLVQVVFFFAVSWLVYFDVIISTESLLQLYLLLGAFPISFYLVYFVVNFHTRKSFFHRVRKSVLSLWTVSLVNNIMAAAPYLLLAFIATPVQIGVFAVAHRLIGVSATLSQVLTSYFSPKFAQATSRYEQGVVFRNSRFATAIVCIPLLIVFILFKRQILGLFGDEFVVVTAVNVLIILASGRMVIGFLGIPEAFLCMTGRERFEFRYSIISIVTFTLFGVFAGIQYGTEGVAIAYAGSTVLRAMLSFRRANNVLKASA